MLKNNTLHILGYASGLGGAQAGSAQGPLMMQNSTYLADLIGRGIKVQWDAMLQPKLPAANALTEITKLCTDLAILTERYITDKKVFTVIGGDHTSAIGTWSGVVHAKRGAGKVGLIWIDAHMDSHTPATSETGNFHGMPLAALLGYGAESLTQICDSSPKLLPENICLIGVRSFERSEAALLKKLNVRIFYMEEVQRRGIKAVLVDAIQLVSRNTIGYGVSLDIDSMDPIDAPGTGVAEPDGIKAVSLCAALTLLANDSRLLGLEIAEFDPNFDQQHKTEKIVTDIIAAVFGE